MKREERRDKNNKGLLKQTQTDNVTFIEQSIETLC